ncbi:hypothetical protein NB640_01440 [Oxalobacter vibrioformis]|uniref:Uncharacterized protein n=1 Tax=Oxalobacter vibrioformis TaxID=933080 RepID=A0A9E9LZE0_9BURK|nr:hypothetical protein [Oxalobacter vibrioformis]WAW10357.1 hypothetical protein NB640_01440 [Oxalobacter vibrioformis]
MRMNRDNEKKEPVMATPDETEAMKLYGDLIRLAIELPTPLLAAPLQEHEVPKVKQFLEWAIRLKRLTGDYLLDRHIADAEEALRRFEEGTSYNRPVQFEDVTYTPTLH